MRICSMQEVAQSPGGSWMVAKTTMEKAIGSAIM
jgi:hypothetical protein